MRVRKRIQNRVAESGLTLPAFSLFALSLWHPWALASHPLRIAPLALMIFSCYVLMEWCNRLQFIRIRSRLTTSLFIMGASILSMSVSSGVASMAMALGMVSSLFSLTYTYDRHEPVVAVFHSSLAISAMSVLCPPLLLLWPVHLFCLASYMRVFALRVFSASVIGFLLPWILVFSFQYIFMGFSFPVFDLDTGYSLVSVVAWAAMTLLGFVSLLHFLKTSYDDKIRVRMIFYCIILFWVSIQVVAVFFPLYLDHILPSLWIVTCPLLTHHLGLSSSRWTTLWFVIVVILLLVGAFYCYHGQ